MARNLVVVEADRGMLLENLMERLGMKKE